MTRRRFLRSAAVAGGGALLIGADATLIEPNHPQLTRLEMPLPRLPQAFDGFTIAQLSDLHYDHRFSVRAIRAAIKIVNDLKPDLIVLTGDFITAGLFTAHPHNPGEAARTAPPCAALAAQLVARMGVFAILGNHDISEGRDWITSIFAAEGIPVLRNSSVPIEQNGSRFWLAGLDDALEGSPDFAATLKGIPANEAVVMLAHEPDMADEVAKYAVDLQLSGHSHGGQIRIPLLGAPYLPLLAKKYPKGLYRVGPLPLYTNRGIGTIRLPARFDCPPEVTLFTLRARAVSS